MSLDCNNWPSYCFKYTCYPVGQGPYRYMGSSYGECYSTTENYGPFTTNQNISTQYSIEIAGNTLPIVNTNRTFMAVAGKLNSIPTKINSVYMWDMGTFWCIDGFTEEVRTYRIKEDCAITRSTIHYLDLRYGACLYKKNIEQIKFDTTSSGENTFKNPWGMRQVGRAIVYGGDKKNWDSSCTEEWHLILDGVDKIISTGKYDPIPEMKSFSAGGSSDLFNPNYPDIADKDVELIIHPLPPTSSDEHAWDDESRYHGYYSYKGATNSANWGIDGGCGDYFYPAWCRALQEDPFWKAAAERRYSITLEGGEFVDSNSYIPPIGVTVDPIPRGTFVRHPIVGDVWQFLFSQRGGTYHLETSPNIDALVLDSLNKNGVTPLNGTMLYYPIGV